MHTVAPRYVLINDAYDHRCSARPPAFRVGTVPRAMLAKLVVDADPSGRFEPGADFGTPQLTDLGCTSVTFVWIGWRRGRRPCPRATASTPTTI